MSLYHFTCSHHVAAIEEAGLVVPGVSLVADLDRMPWQARFAWFTDMAIPDRDALGLTSNFVTCDRTEHRFRVTGPGDLIPWWQLARDLPREHRQQLEEAPGTRPAHWFVSAYPTAVVPDPWRSPRPHTAGVHTR